MQTQLWNTQKQLSPKNFNIHALWYRFRTRKVILHTGKISREKTFADCLLLLCQRCHIPKFVEKSNHTVKLGKGLGTRLGGYCMNQHHTPCATLISTVGLNLTLQYLVRQGGTEREEEWKHSLSATISNNRSSWQSAAQVTITILQSSPLTVCEPFSVD